MSISQHPPPRALTGRGGFARIADTGQTLSGIALHFYLAFLYMLMQRTVHAAYPEKYAGLGAGARSSLKYPGCNV